jgi:PAS domain S-box-containing protein
MFWSKKAVLQTDELRLNNSDTLLGILNNLPTPIFVKDEDLRFVFLNAEHCRLIGKSESELLGRSDLDFYRPEEAAIFMAVERQVFETGAISVTEEEVVLHDGTMMPAITRKSKFQAHDGKSYLIGTNFDLSEIKQREEQYRVLAESVPVGVMQVCQTNRIKFTNRLCLDYFEFDRQPNSLADIVRQLTFCAPHFPAVAQKFETAIRRKDGKTLQVLVISSGWDNSAGDGEKSAMVSIIDITEMALLRQDVENNSRRMGEVAAQTKASVASISASTVQLSRGAAYLSDQTERQMTDLEEMATAIRQLGSSVKKNFEHTQGINQLMLSAAAVAENSSDITNTTALAMAKIKGSSKKIDSIVDLVQEIAFQTNLLALNAAVEAARAGVAGKGFAVVAAEVRALAQRSAAALKEVRGHIHDSNLQIAHGIDLVESMGTKLTDIATTTKKASRLVTMIAAGGNEQSTAVQQVDASVAKLESVAIANAKLFEQLSASVASVDQSMGGLKELVAAKQAKAA